MSEAWIDVKDELPEEMEEVLLCAADGEVVTGGEFVGGKWFTREGRRWHECYMSPVTHWQPIPAPPITARKEEETL